jgi:alpha-beta hydrolase superfamily lysophospholipase
VTADTLPVRRGGDTLAISRWLPDGAADWVVLALHGVMSHAGWFTELGGELAARGVALWGIDRRGSGRARHLSGTVRLEEWIADVSAVADIARAQSRVALFGWCWGARLALAAHAAHPVADRLILAAPGLAMSQLVRDRAARAEAEPGDTVPLPFDETAFSLEREIRTFIRADPLRWQSQPREFVSRSRVLLQQALEVLPTIRSPILALLAEGDEVVDGPAVRQLLHGHEIRALPGGHALILETPSHVAGELATWLQR